MSTFLTQKGNLGLKKLTRDQIVEILPPPITNESLASDLGEPSAFPSLCPQLAFHQFNL
jgi:hypothetical protein